MAKPFQLRIITLITSYDLISYLKNILYHEIHNFNRE